MRRTLAAIACGVVALGGAGCAGRVQTDSGPASAPAASASETLTLRERAAAYWAARMASDDQTQWQLLEPRGQGRLTPQEYAAERQGIRYLGYQIEEATIEGYFATVKVRLLFQPVLQRMLNVPAQTVLMDDRWVRVRGTWYRQFDDRQPPRREP